MSRPARSRKTTYAALLALLVVGSASLIAFQLLSSATQGARPAYSLVLKSRIEMPGISGRLDHMDIDAASNRLFVAALTNNSVEVVDLGAGKVTASVGGFDEPQGVVFVPQDQKLFVSNGGNGTVSVLDSGSLSVVDRVNLGSNADNMRLDPANGVVVVGYGENSSSGLAAINATDDKVVASVGLDGHPESFQIDDALHRVFVNVPTAGAIEVVDESSWTLVAKWAVNGTYDNFPMAVDTTGGRLFVATWFPPKLLAYSSDTGTGVASVGISSDADDVYLDSSYGALMVSCGSGVVDLVRWSSPDQLSLISTVATGPGARTSLYSAQTHVLYVAVPAQANSAAQVELFELARS